MNGQLGSRVPGTGIDSGGHTDPRGCVGPLRRPGQVRWVTVAPAGELIRNRQQLHTIGCKRMTGPASHGRRVLAILSCGHAEPVQAGSKRPDTGDAAPITPICVHQLTLP